MSMWTCPRSILFAPADRAEIADKAIRSQADTVCLDLEDGVALKNKDLARNNITALTGQANDCGKPVWVRINTDILQAARDIEALPDGVENLLVPKARGWSQLLLIDEALRSRFTDNENRPRLVALIEDIASIQHFLNSAQSGPAALVALALGTEDLSGDLGVKPNKLLLRMALYELIKLGRKLRLPVIGFPDSIGNFKDQALLSQNIADARQLGAKGALCIHPRQIEIINDGFSPNAEELAWAKAAFSTKEQVSNEGVALHPVTNQMIDRPVLLQAEEIIKRSRLNDVIQ